MDEVGKMFRKVLLSTLVILMILCNSAFSQTDICGDCNDDTTVNISDLILIVEYLNYGDDGPPLNLENADCDGIAGITISDLVRHSNYLFDGGSLDCQDTGTYSFHVSTDDTIYFPRMLYVPEGLNSVTLPVITSFQDEVQGVYLPFLLYGAEANRVFSYSTTTFFESAILVDRVLEADTGLHYGLPLLYNFPTGQLDYAFVTYTRSEAGVGSIAPELVDRDLFWKVCIERNNELYIPVIEYYDVPLPPDSLYIPDTSLTYSVVAGSNPVDSFIMEITASAMPVSFNLQISEDWISLGDFPPTGSTTPENVIIRIDSDELIVGEYSGRIEVVEVDSEVVVPVTFIEVFLTVVEPIIYPGGDLNCDGQTNVTDAVLLIDYIFRGGPQPVNCP